MTEHDPGATTFTSAVARRNRRRKQTVAAVAGLAVVLGGGAYLLTDHLTGDDQVVKDTGALAPLAPSAPATSAPSVSSSSAAASPSKSTGRSAPATTTTPRPKTTAERIAAARAAAAKATNQVRRPLPPNGNVAVSEKVSVTNTGNLKKDGATLRVVSARADLTGVRELAWAADDGVPVGDARCTQNFHFSNAPAAEKPTLLLCWRTSPSKSVYTIAVTLKGRPSTETSVAAIDKQWDKLG